MSKRSLRPPTRRLNLPEGERRRLERMVSGILARWRGTKETAPILPPKRTSQRRGAFREPLPRRGQSIRRIRGDIERVLDLSRRNDSPRFWGYVNPPGTEIGALADWLASGINQNLSSWRSAPGATLVELQVIEWLGAMVGLPRGASGLLTSGGSMANLTALAAAREAAVRYDLSRMGLSRATAWRLTLYASEEVHHSVVKAAGILGIGSDQARLLPTDRSLRLDMTELRRALRRDRRAGLRPFCVVASAGTVGNGAIDPLPEIARLCRRERLWMHVDACYGGFAVLAPSARRSLRGIGRADSVSLDPHKWLYAPLDAGCVLYRDGGPARRAFRLGGEYIQTFGSTPLEQFAFWDYGPELSRRFRALKIWLTLKYHGAGTLARSIEEDLRLARCLERKIRATPRLELLAPGDLSIVCFRYRPPGRHPEGALDRLNQETLLALQGEGRVFLTNARVLGRFALRACFLNYRTTEADLDLLIDRVLAIGGKRAPRSRPGRRRARAGKRP